MTIGGLSCWLQPVNQKVHVISFINKGMIIIKIIVLSLTSRWVVKICLELASAQSCFRQHRVNVECSLTLLEDVWLVHVAEHLVCREALRDTCLGPLLEVEHQLGPGENKAAVIHGSVWISESNRCRIKIIFFNYLGQNISHYDSLPLCPALIYRTLLINV